MELSDLENIFINLINHKFKNRSWSNLKFDNQILFILLIKNHLQFWSYNSCIFFCKIQSQAKCKIKMEFYNNIEKLK